jgi:hypothetical protein
MQRRGSVLELDEWNMSGPQLQFLFSGLECRDAAEDLVKFLANELPDWQSHLAQQASSAEVERSDPLTIIALILSVPPAIQSSWDLAQRIKLKEKIDRLIGWAKARKARDNINPSVVLPPEGQAVPLDKAVPQQILDAIAAQANAARDQQR